MSTSPTHDTRHASTWPGIATTALRVAFGIIWMVAAALTWLPDFASHYVGYLLNAAQGQPGWNAWWFSAWIALVTPHAALFTWLTRLAVSAIAICLVIGFGGRTLYALGALFSLLVWSTAEGFGGPYAVGVSNIGTAITYVLIFLALIGLHYRAGLVPYSLDYLIERRWPRWQKIAEWSSATEPPPAPEALPPGVQIVAVLGIVVVLALLIAGLPSTLNVKSASPSTAAAAVSPLMLASKEPIQKARDARLPPVAGDGRTATIEVIAEDQKVAIANGVEYQAWTFGGQVPAPMIHLRQGQVVTVKFTNRGTMHHALDFHSAITPPNLNYVDINPGETLEYTFVASTPGAFVYHCGTPPVLLHMANGMFGAIIVDPATPLPEASESYVIVQSEWYTQQMAGNLMGPSFEKMLQMRPDEIVFNGIANQYHDQPLPITAGKRARIYFVNAGPNLWSAFHVIGGMFDKIYPDADASHALSGVSTHSVGPGEGAVFDVILPKAGKYPFVDHSMAHMAIGAVGILQAQGDSAAATPAQPTLTQAGGAATAAPAHAAAPEPAGPYQFDTARGDALYTQHCAACHQATGMGLPGAFPPLKGDPVVLDANPAKHIQAILHGVQGQTINGTAYPSPMPPFGATLSDSEVADIVNHERTSWGNQARNATADDVKAAR